MKKEKDESNDFKRWSITTGHTTLANAIRREIEAYCRLYVNTTTNGGNEHHPHLQEHRIVLVLLLASYLEALINLYCSFKFNREQFEALEKMPVIEKWTTIPTFTVPSYDLDKSKDLYKNLKDIFSCRNGIVHMRPEFSVDEHLIHPGNASVLQRITHDSMMEWLKVPLALIQNLGAHDNSHDAGSFLAVSEAHDVSGNWQDFINRLIKHAQKNPK